MRHTNLSADAVQLVWDELTCAHRGGIEAYYEVRLDDVDERSGVIVDHVTSTTVHISVLTPYRRYAARVRYVNRIGVGPYSQQLLFTTLPTGNVALAMMMLILLLLLLLLLIIIIIIIILYREFCDLVDVCCHMQFNNNNLKKQKV